MIKHQHIVYKDYTFQFYKGEDRMRIDQEGTDMFVLRNKYGEGFLLHGNDEIEDVISLLTKIKEKMKSEEIV